MTTRGVTKHRSMQDWLKSPSPGRGKGGFGKNLKWKDGQKGTGHAVVWMHTSTLPETVWRHAIPIFVPIEVKDEKTGQKETVVHVWSRGHTCHETEDVLGKQYWRGGEKGAPPDSERDVPPERCGACKFDEWLWLQAWAWVNTHTWSGDHKSGKWVEVKKGAGRGIDPCAVLFHLASEADASETTTVHVGGYCGIFGRDELPDDLEKAMRAARISKKDAWKENCKAKAKSVVCVVDNDHPDKGVMIAEETKELGEKMKEEIVKTYKRSEIDIQRNPYALEWDYDRSRQMGKQYEVTALLKQKPDQRILNAIRGDAPDLSSIETPFNQQTLRAFFERNCALPKGTVPWGDLFPTRDQENQWSAADAAATAAAGDAGDGEPAAGTGDEADPSAPTDDVERDDDGDELVACEECDKPMKLTANKCPHCDHVYEDEPPPPTPEPAAAKLRTRSQARSANALPAKVADDDASADDNQDGDIPF